MKRRFEIFAVLGAASMLMLMSASREKMLVK